MKSLVVDDSDSARVVLENLLAPYGPCDQAADGRTGVEMFRRALDSGQPYDLVCLDIVMPEMDGQTALKEIRACEAARGLWAGREVKVLMTTVVDDPDQVLEALTEGIEAYLVKPLGREKFIKALEELGLA
ncbi:MAG: response regulator [Thermodesulfobacteriota bacterium]